MRYLSVVAALIGGLACLVDPLLHLAGAGGGPPAWFGGLLLSVAVLDGGASLVSRSARWLRALVGVCSVVLFWSVLEALYGAFAPGAVDGLVGVAATAAAVIGLRRRPAGRRSERGHRAAPTRRGSGVHAR